MSERLAADNYYPPGAGGAGTVGQGEGGEAGREGEEREREGAEENEEGAEQQVLSFIQ